MSEGQAALSEHKKFPKFCTEKKNYSLCRDEFESYYKAKYPNFAQFYFDDERKPEPKDVLAEDYFEMPEAEYKQKVISQTTTDLRNKEIQMYEDISHNAFSEWSKRHFKEGVKSYKEVDKIKDLLEFLVLIKREHTYSTADGPTQQADIEIKLSSRDYQQGSKSITAHNLRWERAIKDLLTLYRKQSERDAYSSDAKNIMKYYKSLSNQFRKFYVEEVGERQRKGKSVPKNITDAMEAAAAWWENEHNADSIFGKIENEHEKQEQALAAYEVPQCPVCMTQGKKLRHSMEDCFTVRDALKAKGIELPGKGKGRVQANRKSEQQQEDNRGEKSRAKHEPGESYPEDISTQAHANIQKKYEGKGAKGIKSTEDTSGDDRLFERLMPKLMKALAAERNTSYFAYDEDDDNHLAFMARSLDDYRYQV